MNLSLSRADQVFVDSVRQFAADHWRGDSSQPGGLLAELRAEGMTVAERQWFDALVHAGWSVPTWPAAEGGPGWPRLWQFLFMRELAAMGAPLPISLATEVVANVLFPGPPSAARTQWLSDIRHWRSRWCLGFAEPDGVAGQWTTAVRTGSGYVVSGQKTWVTGGLVADWMLCQVALDGLPVWMAVSLREAGVTLHALPVMGSSLAMARVELNGVQIPVERYLGVAEGPDAERPVSVASLVRSGVLRRDLQRLEADSAVLEDPAMQRACAELGVVLSGIEAMEFRALMAAAPAEQGTLRTLLAIRGAEAGQKLGELRVRSMGYHAVPFPDGERFSNEGLFGDELALPAVRRALFDRAWTMYAAHHVESSGSGGSSVEALRDELARTILGTDLGTGLSTDHVMDLAPGSGDTVR
jgi:alkylation response protein AidB-like acyl-CoA dehydrogenase